MCWVVPERGRRSKNLVLQKHTQAAEGPPESEAGPRLQAFGGFGCAKTLVSRIRGKQFILS